MSLRARLLPIARNDRVDGQGLEQLQWWRNGHAHIDETEVWLKPMAERVNTKMFLKADAKHAWPMWSADGKTLFYMSDASGAENIWAVPLAMPKSAKALTHFREGRAVAEHWRWREDDRLRTKFTI